MNRTVAFLLDVFPVIAVVGGVVVVSLLAYAVFRRDRPHLGVVRRSRHGTAVRPPDKREWVLWVGDGMAPAGPDLIGRPVDIRGRTGKVVDATAIMIQVEWDQ